MDSQVERARAWREQKRRDGYLQMTVWVKPDIKHRIEDLAAQHRQDLGEVVTDMVQAYGYARYVGPAEVHTGHRLIDERLALFGQQLAAQMDERVLALAPQEGETPATPAPLRSPILLPGEHGAQIQALRRASKDLERFTLPQLAKHLG